MQLKIRERRLRASFAGGFGRGSIWLAGGVEGALGGKPAVAFGFTSGQGYKVACEYGGGFEFVTVGTSCLYPVC